MASDGAGWRSRSSRAAAARRPCRAIGSPGTTLTDLLERAAAGRLAGQRPGGGSAGPSWPLAACTAGSAATGSCSSRSTTPRAQRGGWDPGQTTVNARTRGPGPDHDRLSRRVQLGRQRGLDPAPEPRRDPPDQPGQHRRRADLSGAGARPRRAAEVLPDRDAHVRPGGPQRRRPGRVAGQAAAERRLHARPTCSTTARSTARTRPTSFELAAQAAGLQVARGPGLRPAGHRLQLVRGRGRRRAAPTACCQRADRDQRGPVTQQVAAALPRARSSAQRGSPRARFTDPAQGGIPAGARSARADHRGDARRAGRYPPAGQAVLTRPTRSATGPRSPYAIYRLRGDEPAARRDLARHRPWRPARSGARRSSQRSSRPAGRHSVLGTYSIDQRRRHHAPPLRRLPDRRGPSGVLEGDRGLARCTARSAAGLTLR